jgi:hypothetical protein
VQADDVGVLEHLERPDLPPNLQARGMKPSDPSAKDRNTKREGERIFARV